MFKRIITLALAVVCLASFAIVGVNALAPEKEGEVVYTATLTTPNKIEDVQGFITYDAAVLKVVEAATPNIYGAIINTNEAGTIYFNATEVNNGLDFTTAATLVEVKFEVIGEGEVAAAMTVEEMTERNGDSYYTNSEKVNDAVVLEEAIVEYVAPTTTVEPTQATTTVEPTATTVVEPTQAPETDATGSTGTQGGTTDVPPTGSTVAIFAVLAVVAMAGAAVVVLRKRVNG
ncbi:MAG: hypothetical protein IJW04_02480 [Ruminococcus sp.]|nr:hypothetical protein [Ruminococcus sp.]